VSGPWDDYKARTNAGPWDDYKPKQKGSGDWATDVKDDGVATVQGLVHAVTSPVETAKGAFDAFVVGPASKLMQKTGATDALVNASNSDPAIAALSRDIEKQKAGFRERTTDALVNQVKEDFSDPAYTITHKPFTTLNYISTLAAPGALLPGRIGQTAGMISNATNLPGLALQGTARVLRPIGAYARDAGRSNAAEIAARRGLSREYGVDLTRGQVSDNASILSKEDNLRYARDGQSPRVMQRFDDAQDTQITNATDRVRQNLTGSQTAMGADDIGRVLGDAYGTERQAARNRVSALYDRAFNADELAAAGVRSDVPVETVMGLRNAIDSAFNYADRPMFPPTPEVTPGAYRAIQAINQFSDANGGLRSAYNNLTMPPQGGNPLVTGVSWQSVDQLRKMLVQARAGARANPADAAALDRIMEGFDQHVGQTNPLLNQARDAHSMRVQRFDPQRTNAAGVNNFLQAISNDANPGKLIFDRLFNSNSIKAGTAEPLIEQLTQIAGHNPQAMSAIREGMLTRLTTNLKTGEAFSPKVTSNNIRDALGGQSSNAYRMLFNDGDLAQLGRYGELLDQIGTTRIAQNASKTSYNLAPLMQRIAGMGLGALTGHGIGASLGTTFAGPVGGAIGAAIGDQVGRFGSNVMAHAAARRAVSGDYTPPVVAPMIANGLAGTISGLNAATPYAAQLAPPGLLSVLLGQDQNRKR
jgi:hypothetical protein